MMVKIKFTRLILDMILQGRNDLEFEVKDSEQLTRYVFRNGFPKIGIQRRCLTSTLAMLWHSPYVATWTQHVFRCITWSIRTMLQPIWYPPRNRIFYFRLYSSLTSIPSPPYTKHITSCIFQKSNLLHTFYRISLQLYEIFYHKMIRGEIFKTHVKFSPSQIAWSHQ